MISILEINERIVKGLKRGYNQNLLLLSSYSNFLYEIREYLLTVNVAQELLDWNTDNIYRIQIEYPLIEFYQNAFASCKMTGNDLFSLELVNRKSNHSPTEKRHQKIDIVITYEENGESFFDSERSLAGIELKGINKSVFSIKKDIERLANAMNLTDSIGKNSIEFCICSFLVRLDNPDKVVDRPVIESLIIRNRKQWENVCNTLRQKYPNLDFCYNAFEVINEPVESVFKFHDEIELEYSETAQETGIVIICILNISRRKK